LRYYSHYFQSSLTRPSIRDPTSKNSKSCSFPLLCSADSCRIIRVLLMVPIYSLVSFLSIVFYRHEVYFQLTSDTYAAIAVASYFELVMHYIAPDLHEQKNYFRSITPKPWIFSFPLPVPWLKKCMGGERGPLRTPRSGLTYTNVRSNH
jgi:hypothetical protein